MYNWITFFGFFREKDFKEGLKLENIYQNIIDEYNEKLLKLQNEQPDLLEMYHCYCLLKSATIDESEKHNQIKRAKQLLGIPEHKNRLGIFGKKIDEDYILEQLRSKSDSMQVLHVSFEEELKLFAIKNGLPANHVSAVAPENLLGDKLETSKDRLTQYEEKRGDFLFATTLPQHKNLYAVRETMANLKKGEREKVGMIRLDKNTYLFLSDENIEITDTIKLKKPKYVYELDVKKFTPETAFEMDGEGNYRFLFDDEWYCDEPQKVLDEQRQPIVKVSEISNVTMLAHDFNLYLAVDPQKVLDILNEKNLNNSFKPVDALKYGVKSGLIKNVNGEMVKFLVKNIEKDSEKQDLTENVQDSEAVTKSDETNTQKQTKSDPVM